MSFGISMMRIVRCSISEQRRDFGQALKWYKIKIYEFYVISRRHKEFRYEKHYMHFQVLLITTQVNYLADICEDTCFQNSKYFLPETVGVQSSSPTKYSQLVRTDLHLCTFNALPGELEACEALELKQNKYYNVSIRSYVILFLVLNKYDSFMLTYQTVLSTQGLLHLASVR